MGLLWPHPQPSCPAAVRVSFISAPIGVAEHPHWRMGRDRARLDLGKFGTGELGRAQAEPTAERAGKRGKGRKGERAGAGSAPRRGWGSWGREAGNGNGGMGTVPAFPVRALGYEGGGRGT